jgi:N6-adenosine-specific RNA methylase IME4
MFPTQKKLEMFAREPYAGWDAWGNEVTSDV